MDDADYKDDRASLGFVVVKQGFDSTLFLADRTHQTKRWWTTRLSDAMSWRVESAAYRAASKLQFGNVEVKGRTEFHRN